MNGKPLYFSIIFIICCVSCTQLPPSNDLVFHNTGAQLTLLYKEQPVMTYQVGVAEPPENKPHHYNRSGFLHPVYTPSGEIITDDFPVDHEHQHGWFYTIRNARYRDSLVDFWNQHKLLGTVKLRSLDSTVIRGRHADIYATLDHISTRFGPILEEKWHLRVIPGDSLHQFIWETVIVNTTSDTLFADKYSYGGLGMRGPAVWNEADSTKFQGHASVLTSEGKTRSESNHTRPTWTAMYGPLGDSSGGWAAFDHPDNYRYPQPVRVHPEMPYFCLAPMVDHSYFLAPGEPMRLQYRLVTFDGDADGEVLGGMAKMISDVVH